MQFQFVGGVICNFFTCSSHIFLFSSFLLGKKEEELDRNKEKEETGSNDEDNKIAEN